MRTIDLTVLPASEYTNSTFHFDEMPLLVFVIGSELIFRLNHLCKCLEIENPSLVAQRLKDSEKVYVEYMPGRRVLGVTEPGLYRTIFRSDKPNAEAFKDLVFGTILPTIRKTGSYVANESNLALPWSSDRMFKLAASTSRSRWIKQQVDKSDKYLKCNTAAGFLFDVLPDREDFEFYRHNRRFMGALANILSTEFKMTRGKVPPKITRKHPKSTGNGYPPSFRKLVAEFVKGWQSEESDY